MTNNLEEKGTGVKLVKIPESDSKLNFYKSL